MDTLLIQPSDSFPGVTALRITPDVPGYICVEFVGGDQPKVSMIDQDVLGQLGLVAAPAAEPT
jgi:hypothetical protein